MLLDTETIDPLPKEKFSGLPEEAQPYFSLPTELQIKTPDQAKQALAKLPYIDLDLIDRHRANRLRLSNVAFPVDRIISTQRDLKSWDTNAKKVTSDGKPVPSIDWALRFTRDLTRNPNEPIQISLFQDDKGEMWGIVGDGTHSVMAAKLLAKDSILVDLLIPRSPDQVDHYCGDVIAEVTARRQAA